VRFWTLLEDLEPFFRLDIGRNLGACYQLEIYINQMFLAARGRCRIGKWWRNFEANPFLCRDVVEENTFAGHFWELWSSIFCVVSFDGFLRSRRTQLAHFCNPLARLWCTFEVSNKNKKVSPSETKARRRKRDCRTPLSHWCLWLVVLLAYVHICILLNGCCVSSFILPLSLIS